MAVYAPLAIAPMRAGTSDADPKQATKTRVAWVSGWLAGGREDLRSRRRWSGTAGAA